MFVYVQKVLTRYPLVSHSSYTCTVIDLDNPFILSMLKSSLALNTVIYVKAYFGIIIKRNAKLNITNNFLWNLIVNLFVIVIILRITDKWGQFLEEL